MLNNMMIDFNSGIIIQMSLDEKVSLLENIIQIWDLRKNLGPILSKEEDIISNRIVMSENDLELENIQSSMNKSSSLMKRSTSRVKKYNKKIQKKKNKD